MRLRIVISRVALIVAIPLAASCVPKSDFDQLANDFAAAQSEIDALETEVETIRSQLEEATADLSAAESQVNELENTLAEVESTNEELELEIAEANTQVENLRLCIEGAGARVELIRMVFVPALTGEISAMSESEAFRLFLDWTESIEATDDPELKTRFDALIDSGYSDEKMADFFIYLIESTSETLE